jgi:membrane-bound lytic murein transglycosylase D
MEELEVETSTDAEFVMELPMDDDRPPRPAGRIEPIFVPTATVTFDLPMLEHERVQFWIDYLSGRGARVFSKWLARTTRYVPLQWRILDDYGLPRDLVFLSMVESGFSTSAYSWAHAAGPWQFVQSTGRRYGLRIDFWVDDRRDFERATDAAARYLRDLYQRYGDWWVAMAAYNAGEGKVNRAIRRYGTQDFWALSQRRYLKRETKQYVPKILAAAQVSKRAIQYGFDDIEYQPPLAFEVVTVTTAVSLQTFARACPQETDRDELEGLNPSLRTGVTPPGERWPVRVPATVTATCADALRAAAHEDPYVYRYHRLTGSNVEVDQLARRYHTTSDAILAFSNIEADQLTDFEELVVPVPRAMADRVPVEVPPMLSYRPPNYGPQGVRLVRYRVRSGDSLWKIAGRFRVSITDLCRWNGLRRSSVLPIGRRLRIYQGNRRAVARASRATRTTRSKPARPVASSTPRGAAPQHEVKPGESYWSIAHHHGTTIEALLAANDRSLSDVLQPGQRLSIPAPAAARSTRATPPASGVHRVRSGESFWSIAQQYGVSIEDLCRWNGLKTTDVLQPGQELVIEPR